MAAYSNNQLNHWQMMTVEEYNAAIDKCETIDELEPIAREILLSRQAWLRYVCWETVQRRFGEFNTEGQRQALLVVDAMNWISADFYASGKVDDAALMFVRRLRDHAEKTKCKWIAIAADGPHEHSIRRLATPEYKSSRGDTPVEILAICRKVKEMCDEFSIPHVECHGYEADDIAATLSTTARARGYKTFIATNDKDYWQLVNDDVCLMSKNIYVTERLIRDKHGLTPHQVVDYLCITGKDDAPNMVGIGPKTAIEWLAKYRDMIGIMDAAHGMKEAKRDAVLAFAPRYFEVRNLHRLYRDLPITFDWSTPHCLN